MGESKRRKESLGNQYGQDSERILPGIPITKAQSAKFVKTTTTGVWIGIGIMIANGFTVRFSGPAFGFWEVY